MSNRPDDVDSASSSTHLLMMPLHTPVYDAPRVQELESQHHVCGVERSSRLIERALKVEVVEELASRHPLLSFSGGKAGDVI